MSRKSRMRRSQAQTPKPEEDFEVLDAAEPEEETPAYATIPEAKPAETEEDPYEVLQRNFDAANKAREEAEERAKNEALARQQAERQRDELDGRVSKNALTELESHKALVQSEYTRTEHEIAAAENAYAEAMQAGDYAAATKAQRAIVRIENKLNQLEGIYANIEEKIKNPPKPQVQARQVDEFEEGLRQLPRPIQEWAREHEEDLRKRTHVAIAAGNLAVSKGLQPGSDAYLDFMDEQMGYAVDDDEPEPTPAPEPVVAEQRRTRRQPPMAAPVTRGSSNDTSKVYLTDFDKKTAKDLGMTEREYAKFVREAPNSPIAKRFAIQSSQRGGR